MRKSNFSKETFGWNSKFLKEDLILKEDWPPSPFPRRQDTNSLHCNYRIRSNAIQCACIIDSLPECRILGQGKTWKDWIIEELLILLHHYYLEEIPRNITLSSILIFLLLSELSFHYLHDNIMIIYRLSRQAWSTSKRRQEERMRRGEGRAYFIFGSGKGPLLLNLFHNSR